MVKKVKKYPHAFFERNTWNHRTKKLLPDYTIKYGKKGGFETAEEAEKAYQEHIKEFDRKMNMTFMDRTDSYGAGLSGLFLSGCCAAVYPV